MPLKHFITDNKSIAKAFIDYIEYIYGGNCMIDDQDEEGVHLSMNVPGDLKREDFENDVQDFCEEHNCSFELVNQAPNAPSPQFFSENMKLMYPRVKNYEALAKDPRKLEKAKVLFKQSWNQEFNEEDEDDKEDIVLLWNEYMEELSEWKPVEVKLHYNQDLKQDSDKNDGLNKLKAACKQIAENHNMFHYDARSKESQIYHVEKAIKNLKELTGLDFKVIHFEEEPGGRDEEGSWYYPTYTLESTNDGTKYQMNLCFSGGYKQAINFEDFQIKEPKQDLKEDEDPKLEIAKKIYNEQIDDGKLLSFEKVYKLSDPFISYIDSIFKSFSKEEYVIWLVDNDVIIPEEYDVESKEEVKDILRNKSNEEFINLAQEIANEWGGAEQIYKLNTLQGLQEMLEEISEGEDVEDSEIKDSQTWAIMYEYTDDEKTFKEHLGERDFDYVRGNSEDEAIENFKKQVKEELVYPKGKYLRIMRVGKLSGKENLNQVKWTIHSEIVKDSEGSHKYAIILNGEWYTTVDSYEKAMEQQEKLQSTDDEDFIREYGEFPTVEIRELKDSVKDAPVYQMTGKLVNALNHRDVKQHKNFPDVIGSKEEVSQKCKEYQDIWNTGRTDENIWILTPVLVGSENR